MRRSKTTTDCTSTSGLPFTVLAIACLVLTLVGPMACDNDDPTESDDHETTAATNQASPESGDVGVIIESPNEGGGLIDPERSTTLRRERDRNFLDVQGLLTRADIRSLAQYLEGLEGEPSTLEGTYASESYNSLRFARLPTGLGVSVQVWQFGRGSAAVEHMQTLERGYPIPSATNIAGDDAFRAKFGGIDQVVFRAPGNRIVVIACDETVCTQDGHIVALANRVHERLYQR